VISFIAESVAELTIGRNVAAMHACNTFLLRRNTLISTQNVLYVENNEETPAIDGCSPCGEQFFFADIPRKRLTGACNPRD
jgi:hypothetical protein